MVVVVDGLAASGAYIAALSADHIIAQDTSLVGSIGVLFQYPNFTERSKRIGIKVEEIKSSPLKAAPNGFEPTSPEARAAIEAIVRDSYAWFKEPGEGPPRTWTTASLPRSPTAAFSPAARRSPLKLIDALGNEKTALDWLAERKEGTGRHCRCAIIRCSRDSASFPSCIVAAWSFEAVGLSSFARRIEEWGAVQAVERLNLDGLLALWHPPSSN